jgi:hypothetical protein
MIKGICVIGLDNPRIQTEGSPMFAFHDTVSIEYIYTDRSDCS